MQIKGQNFSSDVIAWIQETIDQQPGISRTRLSREVCEFLDWRNARGALKEMSCRLALLKLHRMGLITLPPAAQQPPSRNGHNGAFEAIEEPPAIACTLHELGAIEFIPIKRWDRKRSRIWNGFMARYHYLGPGPLCGAQIRYLIYSERYGYLGGLAFSSAAWRLEARDRWIGWDEGARRQNLQKVVCNSRFLILPQVRVSNLASHVLSLCAKGLGHDWQERYGIAPLLLETFVEQGRFKGTCYRAANWIYIGATKGRGRQDRNNEYGVAVKDIYAYPLHANARERLCDGPAKPIVLKNTQAPADWAEEEFGTAPVGDERRKKRLLILARDFFARPQQSIPATCEGDRAKTKAAYRFFDHKDHTMDNILAPHYEATMARMSTEKVVLAVQDTTVLTYDHPNTAGLGPIGSNKEGSIGLLLHNTLCFNPEGTPLGVLNVQCWTRDPEDFGKKHRRATLPIEQKESYKWLRSFQALVEAQKRCPDTLLVSIGDREADIYELFVLAMENPKGPRLLVRAEQKRLVADGQGHLWDHLRRQSLAATVEVHVPRRGNRAARVAKLEVRFAKVTLKPPVYKPELGEVTIWAILAEEVDCPEGATPLSWMLLTTCEVTSADEAIEKLNWYAGRWGIEVYHRTLKSGCNIEERQLGHADRLEACLAIDMVVAWRIFHLTKLGREVPDLPCTVFFEEAEWKALVAYKTQNPIPPDKPPSLRDMTRLVASLGGFLGRKGDGEPGTKSLWIGLQRLDDITEMWKITMRFYAPDNVDPPPGTQ